MLAFCVRMRVHHETFLVLLVFSNYKCTSFMVFFYSSKWLTSFYNLPMIGNTNCRWRNNFSLPNQDYLTIVTCTPYGINTQCLLVRGHRIPNADGEDKTTSDAMQLNALYIAPFIGIPICLVIVIYMMLS